MDNKMQITALALFAVLAICLLFSLDSVISFLHIKQSTDFRRDNPYYFRAATVKPKQDNLIGKYSLTMQELNYEGLVFLNGKPATIDLAPDGSMTITNLPVWEPDGATQYNFKCSRLVSASGHWRIIESGRNNGKKLWGLELRDDSGELLTKLARVVIITNNDPPHGFFFDFGTDDRIKVMLYERARY